MDKVTQLRAEAKKLKDQARKIVNDRDLTELSEEENEQVDSLLSEAEDVESQATAEQERLEEVAKRKTRLDAKLAPRKFDVSGQRDPIHEAADDIKVGKNRVEDDPKKGFKTPREFLEAVMRNDPRAVKDERLEFLATAGSDEHGTYADPYGGFLVPAGFSPQLLSTQLDVGDPTGARTRKIPMATRTVEIPARTDKTHTSSVSGGLTVSRRAETASLSSSRMTVEQVKLVANSLFGFTYATEELLTDSAMSFMAIVEAGFQDEFTSRLVIERLTGTGVGEFEGVLNGPATISVSKETGQAAATIVYENILNMYARAWRPQMWLANYNTLPQLAQLQLALGTAGVLVWNREAESGPPATLMGLPLFFSEHCETLGTAGDIYLCNWMEYLEGTYQGMQSGESIHVRFTNHERAFKFWMRNDGRCWWRSALTPENGSTLSPFVTLATRS